ncbi:hypothetical protein HDU76_011523, partial [Blyttiomyces sp. JEL0837]
NETTARKIHESCPRLRDLALSDVSEDMTVSVAVGCGDRLRSLKLCNVGGVGVHGSSSLSDAAVEAVARSCKGLRMFRVLFGLVGEDGQENRQDVVVEGDANEEVEVQQRFGGGLVRRCRRINRRKGNGYGRNWMEKERKRSLSDGDISVQPSSTAWLVDSVPTTPITPPTTTSSQRRAVTDTSLTHLLESCHHLTDFGIVGPGAPVTRKLLEALVSKPCSKTLLKVSFSGSNMRLRDLFEAVGVARREAEMMGWDELRRKRRRVGGVDADNDSDNDDEEIEDRLREVRSKAVLPNLTVLEAAWLSSPCGGNVGAGVAMPRNTRHQSRRQYVRNGKRGLARSGSLSDDEMEFDYTDVDVDEWRENVAGGRNGKRSRDSSDGDESDVEEYTMGKESKLQDKFGNMDIDLMSDPPLTLSEVRNFVRGFRDLRLLDLRQRSGSSQLIRGFITPKAAVSPTDSKAKSEPWWKSSGSEEGNDGGGDEGVPLCWRGGQLHRMVNARGLPVDVLLGSLEEELSVSYNPQPKANPIESGRRNASFFLTSEAKCLDFKKKSVISSRLAPATDKSINELTLQVHLGSSDSLDRTIDPTHNDHQGFKIISISQSVSVMEESGFHLDPRSPQMTSHDQGPSNTTASPIRSPSKHRRSESKSPRKKKQKLVLSEEFIEDENEDRLQVGLSASGDKDSVSVDQVVTGEDEHVVTGENAGEKEHLGQSPKRKKRKRNMSFVVGEAEEEEKESESESGSGVKAQEAPSLVGSVEGEKAGKPRKKRKRIVSEEFVGDEDTATQSAFSSVEGYVIEDGLIRVGDDRVVGDVIKAGLGIESQVVGDDRMVEDVIEAGLCTESPVLGDDRMVGVVIESGSSTESQGVGNDRMVEDVIETGLGAESQVASANVSNVEPQQDLEESVIEIKKEDNSCAFDNTRKDEAGSESDADDVGFIIWLGDHSDSDCDEHGLEGGDHVDEHKKADLIKSDPDTANARGTRRSRRSSRGITGGNVELRDGFSFADPRDKVYRDALTQMLQAHPTAHGLSFYVYAIYFVRCIYDKQYRDKSQGGTSQDFILGELQHCCQGPIGKDVVSIVHQFISNYGAFLRVDVLAASGFLPKGNPPDFITCDSVDLDMLQIPPGYVDEWTALDWITAANTMADAFITLYCRTFSFNDEQANKVYFNKRLFSHVMTIASELNTRKPLRTVTLTQLIELIWTRKLKPLSTHRKSQSWPKRGEEATKISPKKEVVDSETNTSAESSCKGIQAYEEALAYFSKVRGRAQNNSRYCVYILYILRCLFDEKYRSQSIGTEGATFIQNQLEPFLDKQKSHFHEIQLALPNQPVVLGQNAFGVRNLLSGGKVLELTAQEWIDKTNELIDIFMKLYRVFFQLDEVRGKYLSLDKQIFTALMSVFVVLKRERPDPDLTLSDLAVLVWKADKIEALKKAWFSEYGVAWPQREYDGRNPSPEGNEAHDSRLDEEDEAYDSKDELDDQSESGEPLIKRTPQGSKGDQQEKGPANLRMSTTPVAPSNMTGWPIQSLTVLRPYTEALEYFANNQSLLDEEYYQKSIGSAGGRFIQKELNTVAPGDRTIFNGLQWYMPQREILLRQDAFGIKELLQGLTISQMTKEDWISKTRLLLVSLKTPTMPDSCASLDDLRDIVFQRQSQAFLKAWSEVHGVDWPHRGSGVIQEDGVMVDDSEGEKSKSNKNNKVMQPLETSACGNDLRRVPPSESSNTAEKIYTSAQSCSQNEEVAFANPPFIGVEAYEEAMQYFAALPAYKNSLSINVDMLYLLRCLLDNDYREKSLGTSNAPFIQSQIHRLSAGRGGLFHDLQWMLPQCDILLSEPALGVQGLLHGCHVLELKTKEWIAKTNELVDVFLNLYFAFFQLSESRKIGLQRCVFATLRSVLIVLKHAKPAPLSSLKDLVTLLWNQKVDYLCKVWEKEHGLEFPHTMMDSESVTVKLNNKHPIADDKKVDSSVKPGRSHPVTPKDKRATDPIAGDSNAKPGRSHPTCLHFIFTKPLLKGAEAYEEALRYFSEVDIKKSFLDEDYFGKGTGSLGLSLFEQRMRPFAGDRKLNFRDVEMVLYKRDIILKHCGLTISGFLQSLDIHGMTTLDWINATNHFTDIIVDIYCVLFQLNAFRAQKIRFAQSVLRAVMAAIAALKKLEPDPLLSLTDIAQFVWKNKSQGFLTAWKVEHQVQWPEKRDDNENLACDNNMSDAVMNYRNDNEEFATNGAMSDALESSDDELDDNLFVELGGGGDSDDGEDVDDCSTTVRPTAQPGGSASPVKRPRGHPGRRSAKDGNEEVFVEGQPKAAGSAHTTPWLWPKGILGSLVGDERASAVGSPKTIAGSPWLWPKEMLESLTKGSPSL